MESSIYGLTIVAEKKDVESISLILGVGCKENRDNWIHEIELESSEIPDPINYFLDFLDGHYSDLYDLGISETEITLWITYGYDDQCNLEFLPEDLKRLGDNGIGLCISCYKN